MAAEEEMAGDKATKREAGVAEYITEAATTPNRNIRHIVTKKKKKTAE